MFKRRWIHGGIAGTGLFPVDSRFFFAVVIEVPIDENPVPWLASNLHI
jgi:hypothetical protein